MPQTPSQVEPGNLKSAPAAGWAAASEPEAQIIIIIIILLIIIIIITIIIIIIIIIIQVRVTGRVTRSGQAPGPGQAAEPGSVSEPTQGRSGGRASGRSLEAATEPRSPGLQSPNTAPDHQKLELE
jgi:hypothetical protein